MKKTVFITFLVLFFYGICCADFYSDTWGTRYCRDIQIIKKDKNSKKTIFF